MTPWKAVSILSGLSAGEIKKRKCCFNSAIGCCLVVFSEEQLKEEREEEEALTGKDEEEQRIADMGRPMLGDHVKLEIIIEESYEFKVRQGVRLCVYVVK